MNREQLLKRICEQLTDWERTHQWGELWIEVKDGVPTLFKATVQQKLNSYQLGGFPHARRETR